MLPARSDEPVLDRATIERVLAENGHIVAQAARQLGMSRQALYRRMEKLGIKESPARSGLASGFADDNALALSWSMAGWATLWLGGIALLTLVSYMVAKHFIASPWMAAVAAGLVITPLVAWAGSMIATRWSRMARALADGIASIKDRDFSVSVTRATRDEMGELVDAYNGLGDRLRVERQSLYQRELMLDTVIQTTPLALVLTNDGDAVLYSNTTARQLFGEGRKLEGERFSRYLAVAPAPLREAIERGGDTLFTLELAGEPQVYHVSQRRFLLNAQPHRLLMLKQLTREINSQEVATWKKVIRVIAHELNNSLAPISSLAHSGQILARSPPDPEQLIRVFATIEERAQASRRIHRGLFASSRSCRIRGSRRCRGTCCSNDCARWSHSGSWARRRSAPPVSTPRRSNRR